ncbi:unnamed protein product [Callosobruchus maculatus]|uniref:Uncharacterized protein n=1 Tax=Callosobruchus maculatus TaxID=64391 RepID=A0A653BHM2_CALMS|nr:unnamed protein product [Callosobruchus maculatus]
MIVIQAVRPVSLALENFNHYGRSCSLVGWNREYCFFG